MLEEAERLDTGEYKLLVAVNMFLACAARAIALPTDREHVAMVFAKCACSGAREHVALVAGDKKPPKMHEEQGTTKLRIVDPFADEGVWAIVDDGCNSCTHSTAWRKNAQEK